MIDPDTPDSVQGDTPSGQDPATARYRDETATGGDSAAGEGVHGADSDAADSGPVADARAAAPDPQEVKTTGDDSSAAKDPGAWVTGDEPMTGPQASYLETLAQQAGEEPPAGLTKAEASRAIDDLRGKAG